MGQQQLLLLVLSTVTVGLATVAGIEAYEAAREAAQSRRVTQEAYELAQDAQVKGEKPKLFGGKRATDPGVIDPSWKVWAFSEHNGSYKTSPDILDPPGGGAHVERIDGIECIFFASAIDTKSGGSLSFSSPHLVLTCASDNFIAAVNITGTSPEDLKMKSTTY